MKKFDAKQEALHMIEWIRAWFEANGRTATAGICICGGKDSTVAAKLLCEALGTQRVFGVLMPNGEQADLCDAERVAQHLGIPYSIVNIEKAAANTMDCILHAVRSPANAQPWEASEDVRINLPPRIRMAVLYGIAQSFPGGGRVANTCNRSEDYIGYSTKYGDAAGDFSPLSHYTVTEVRQIGHAMGLPADLVEKKPSDGLCGKTDEERIGFSYEVLDAYIETGVCGDAQVKEKIDRMHAANLHKLQLMPACPKRED